MNGRKSAPKTGRKLPERNGVGRFQEENESVLSFRHDGLVCTLARLPDPGFTPAIEQHQGLRSLSVSHLVHLPRFQGQIQDARLAQPWDSRFGHKETLPLRMTLRAERAPVLQEQSHIRVIISK